MRSDGPPFIVRLFLILIICAVLFLTARDFYLNFGGSPTQKVTHYAQDAPSPPSAQTKSHASPVKVPVALPTEQKDQLRDPIPTPAPPVSLREPPVENLNEGNLQEVREPAKLSNAPADNKNLGAKSLRADNGKLPTGSLRSGSEPTGSLRTGAEAKTAGDLRRPEEAAVKGGLRPDQSSLPTGSLR